MIEITITPKDLALAELLVGLEKIGSSAFPQTAKMFKMSANLIQYTWKSYALGAPIPGSANRLKNPTGKYASSIKIRKLGAFDYEIASNSEIAKMLEDGTKTYDMKKTHPYGVRSRVSKKGDPYLIIPFRHGVPGSKSYGPMPEQIYGMIRNYVKSGQIKKSEVITGKSSEPNFYGNMINRARYSWGSRIKGTGLPNLEGMLVMNTSTPKSNRSEYMTFRIISVNSPAHKWIQPARPAMGIIGAVVNNTKDIVNSMIEKGLKEDLGI